MASSRRRALKALGLSSLAVASKSTLPALIHPLVPQQPGSSGVTLRFFTEAEAETVGALVERIIPATDTPGAKAAKVDQYIDYHLSVAAQRVQETFRQGLQWLDAASKTRFGSPFVRLAAAEQDAILESAASFSEASAEARFFQSVKRSTIEGSGWK